MKGEEDGSWNKIFMEIFRSMLHALFLRFSPVLDWIELILAWFEDIFTLYKLAADKVGLDHYKWLLHKR